MGRKARMYENSNDKKRDKWGKGSGKKELTEKSKKGAKRRT